MTTDPEEPPRLLRVLPVNDEHGTRDGGRRVVSLVEMWSDRLVVRWVEFPMAVNNPRDFVRRPPDGVSDNVGTTYRETGTGSSGSKTRIDADARYVPPVPTAATELVVRWWEGQRTVIRLADR
jgi:hypothetical protein